MQRQDGMTLIEILVALGIFVMLGSGLVMFLRDGIATWQVGESRREAVERAEAILEPLAADLRSLFTQPDPGPGGGFVDVLLLCDRDQHRRPRLRMVSALDEETRNPISRIAGSLTGGVAEIDYINDSMEAKLGILRAPGGLCEVSYSMGPEADSELLWRGFKSPIGGPGSVFIDSNLAPDEDGTPRRSRPIADGVLYMEWSFWGGDRRHWVGGKAQAPIKVWDSTRGIIKMPKESGVSWDPSSRDDPFDDVFPDTVEILLVLRPNRSKALARLSADLDDSARTIRVDNTAQYPVTPDSYIRIDAEWIRVGEIGPRSFNDCQRGARGTTAVDHRRGTSVVHGSNFHKTVRIPTSRDPGGVR